MVSAARELADPVRFGIVGCGVIGPTHADAITSIPGARLVAVADPEVHRAERLAARYDAVAYATLDEMLAREHLDIVNVCTASGLHGEHACQVMLSGRHVIVEKPMEISRAAIDNMLRVQGQAGVKLAVISQHRFDSGSKRVHTLVSERALGRLVLGSASVPWWRSQAYYDSGAWRGTRALDGGGVLMNQSIHSIDLLQWLMGRATSVYAYADTLAHDMETEDVAVAVIRFAGGALGTIAATTAAYPGVTTRVEIFGDKGSAVVENDTLRYLHLARDDDGDISPYGAAGSPSSDQTEDVTASGDPSAVTPNSHALQIADMIDAIREDRAPLVDGETGRRPVEIILAIYESARTGREVTLP